MSKFLFEIQQKNRLEQKGLLKRFSIICYGHQESVAEIRAHKAAKYKELKKNRNSKEFDEWFLNYKPDVSDNTNETTNTKTYKGEKTPNTTKAKTPNTTKAKTPNEKKTKKSKKAKKSVKSGFFNFYGKKTRKNLKSIY
jgi:hypothetical protein